MALSVPPGDEAFAALAPAPAAPEVIIFSYILLFFFLSLVASLLQRDLVYIPAIQRRRSGPRLFDLDYVGAFSVCATYILEISDYVGAFSVCATYILGDIVYVGAFSVCATYILGDIVYVGAFSVCATYILEI